MSEDELKDNYTKMMEQALKQGLIEWEPKVGDETDKGVIIAWRGLPYKAHVSQGNNELIFKPSIEQLMDLVPNISIYYHPETKTLATLKNVYKATSLKTGLIQVVIYEQHGKKWSQDGARWE